MGDLFSRIAPYPKRLPLWEHKSPAAGRRLKPPDSGYIRRGMRVLHMPPAGKTVWATLHPSRDLPLYRAILLRVRTASRSDHSRRSSSASANAAGEAYCLVVFWMVVAFSFTCGVVVCFVVVVCF